MNSEQTQVKLIDALANFYKHKDEWPAGAWNSLDGQSGQTAKILQAVGIEQYSTGQFRTGLSILCSESAVPTDMAPILKNWSKTLILAYEQELRTQNMI